MRIPEEELKRSIWPLFHGLFAAGMTYAAIDFIVRLPARWPQLEYLDRCVQFGLLSLFGSWSGRTLVYTRPRGSSQG
jgi:hypothetical protein